jgi:hypothetical protein
MLEQGPVVYLNWLAAVEQKPLLYTVEYPLYTDAHIVAETHYGPYHFLNATPTIHGIGTGNFLTLIFQKQMLNDTMAEHPRTRSLL